LSRMTSPAWPRNSKLQGPTDTDHAANDPAVVSPTGRQTS